MRNKAIQILLCGMPGCGKSVVGKTLAQLLSYPFIDLDEVIERRDPRSCRDMALKEGEEFFRQAEAEAWKEICDCKGVIALGGGTLHYCEVKGTYIVYLEGDFKTSYQRRCRSKGIPSYLNQKDPYLSYCQVAERRLPLFKERSDVTVCVDGKSPQEIAKEIYTWTFMSCCNT